MPRHRILAFLMILIAGLAAATAASADAASAEIFKVCRDPDNLPFSNARSEGFEDRIAELLGAGLGRKVEFYDLASRSNFIRDTLKFRLPGGDYRCDVVMGVPAGFDQVVRTRAYYRSTYALVIAQGRRLDGVRTVEDLLAQPRAKLGTLRIGVIDRSPASRWLVNHRLLRLRVPYRLLIADPGQTSGRVIESDLAAGRLDAAIVWGPIAGYYANNSAAPKLRVIPMKSEKGVKFEFDIAIGLRVGEKEWQQRIETLIDRDRAKIEAILADYGVPVVTAGVRSAASSRQPAR